MKLQPVDLQKMSHSELLVIAERALRYETALREIANKFRFHDDHCESVDIARKALEKD